MKYITFLNITAKLIFTVSIFIFIHKVSDYLYVPLLNSLGFLVAGILAIWIAFKNFKIKYKFPTKEEIIRQLKEGGIIFLSTISISFYTISNSFILGLLTNNTFVGYYAAGEKIVRAIQGLWRPVSQTIYPYFSKLYFENKEKAKKALFKMLVFAGCITLILSIVGCLSAPFVVKVFLGKNFKPSVKVIQILIFIIFAIGINNILGIQGLVAFGYGKLFTIVVTLAAFFHLILLFIFIHIYGYIGPAIATLTSELFICLLEYMILKKIKIL